MIIYKATNKIDGKCYIGQTTFSLERRKNEHLKSSRRQKPRFYIHRAIKKHGMGNFTWEILYECDTRKELDQAELKFIEQCESLAPNGYNCVLMAHGGDIFSQLPKQRMNEIRKKISEGTKKGIAKSNRNSANFGEANGMYGKKHRKESIEKMKEASTGVIKSKETIEKISKSLIGNQRAKGFKHTKETRDKITKGLLKYYADQKNSKACLITLLFLF